MQDVMLDLETLDTKPTAVVLAIGAVFFDPKTGELGQRFYQELANDVESQLAMGRTMSYKTIQWWMKQGDKARELFNPLENNSAPRTLHTLNLFQNFLGPLKPNIWGNGSDFDNMLLASLYESYNTPVPWQFYRNRCYRTIKQSFYGIAPLKREGTHHNALDDAVTQATHLMEIMRCVNSHSSASQAELALAKTPLPSS